MRTKPRAWWLGLSAVLALAGASLVEQPAAGPLARPLAELVPAGPLLVLEAHDFASVVRDWDASPEKQLWLASSDYAAFSRSRLYLQLKQAQDEFAMAAGLPPDMSLVDSVAGGESTLALYDIGKLEFLYVTRMPSARAVENALWRARGNYEPREAAGARYYVHVDKASRRVVAFATTGDLLLLATREDLLAGALVLAGGQKQTAVNGEPWFADAVRAAESSEGTPTAASENRPDLRLVVNLATVVRSPYFRSYWIQGNVSEMRQYRVAISDLYRSPAEIRERRLLLRSNSTAMVAGDASKGESGLAEALRLVPADSGIYRAWAAPSGSDALSVLEEKVLSPRAAALPPSTIAPNVSLTEGGVGSESDLETRIDEAPLLSAGDRFEPVELKKLLAGTKLEAMLETASSQVASDGVFVRTPTAVALLAASDWNADAVRHALQAAVENQWTTSALGAGWAEHPQGRATYYALDGLAPLAMATQGRLLVVADSASLLTAVLDRASEPAASRSEAGKDLVYAARFDHAREGASFLKIMRLIDYPNRPAASAANAGGEGEPPFFSGNMASLSRTLSRVESASIVVGERGPSVAVTTVYRLRR